MPSKWEVQTEVVAREVPACTPGVPSSGGTQLLVTPSTPIRPVRNLTFIERVSRVESNTAYWRPSTGSLGLLETIAKRGSSDTFIPVCARPEGELNANFLAHNNEWVSLNQDRFKLSKTSQTLRHLQCISDHAEVSGKQLKDGLSKQLPAMAEDDYYIVKYRDYSTYATKKFSKEAVGEGFLGPRYVERYFAVRVGQQPGVFIPISQGKFLHAVELLQTAQHGAVATMKTRGGADDLPALTADQFKSLAGVDDEEASARRQQRGAAGSDELHPWDWSPSAISKRWNRFMEAQYLSVGRFAVKVIISGAGVYILYRAIRPQPMLEHNGSSNRRSSRGRQQRGHYHDDEPTFGGFLADVASLNMKDAMDYLLAPREY